MRSARMRWSSTFRIPNRLGYSTGSSQSKHTAIKTATYIASATLVAGTGFWWSTTVRDNVPLLDNRPAEHMIPKSGFSKDEVTEMLLQGAYSFLVKKVPGVNRYDGVQLASNSPCEDRFIHGQIPSPWDRGKSWMAWAIFDGHAGWQTADFLEKQLLPQVQHSMSQVKPATEQQVISEDMIQRAITKAFVDLDSSIMDSAQQIT